MLTRNRDPLQYEHRFREIDSLATRQLLGDISHDEVAELNKVFMMKNGSYYFKSWKEPAGIIAWNIYPLAALYGVAVALAGYARFIKGYNNLWLAAPFAPFWTFALYNYVRQPTVEIDNCFRYILAKRAATCELQANSKRFSKNPFTQTAEYRNLRAALEQKNLTLYQLEAELVDKINSGNFKWEIFSQNINGWNILTIGKNYQRQYVTLNGENK